MQGEETCEEKGQMDAADGSSRSAGGGEGGDYQSADLIRVEMRPLYISAALNTYQYHQSNCIGFTNCSFISACTSRGLQRRSSSQIQKRPVPTYEDGLTQIIEGQAMKS